MVLLPFGNPALSFAILEYQKSGGILKLVLQAWSYHGNPLLLKIL